LTIVVNKMPASGSMLDVELLGSHIPEARGLVIIPRELDAAAKLAVGEFDWRDAPPRWQRSCAELAVNLIDDWHRLGLTL
jgi:transposase